MSDCFVIMPISTPPHLVDAYRNDEDHFQHVLDHLFQPAIENAGYNMVPPSFAGSVLIPAEIITSLEESDLVLCDISSLNPNVFFEGGIRTALNKPVAFVKDRLTERIPFDTGAIGHFTYDESLTGWALKDQIPKLTDHIRSVGAVGDQNAMWKYFGMRLQGGAPLGETGIDQRLEYIMNAVDRMIVKTDSQDSTVLRTKLRQMQVEGFGRQWSESVPGYLQAVLSADNTAAILFMDPPPLTTEMRVILESMVEKVGLKLQVQYRSIS